MYFSVSDVRDNKAAALTVVAAQRLGEDVLLGEKAHLAFETAVVHISKLAKQSNLPAVAAQMLNLNDEQRGKALRAGIRELRNLLGGQEEALRFFGQAYAPKSGLRFESIGAQQDSIMSVKNRAALYAARAVHQRRLMPEQEGHTECERAFVDFMKSIHRCLDRAAEDREIDGALARNIMSEIEEAAHSGRKPAAVNHISMLQLGAAEEYFQESRNKMLAQYAKLLNPEAARSKDSGPTLN